MRIARWWRAMRARRRDRKGYWAYVLSIGDTEAKQIDERPRYE